MLNDLLLLSGNDIPYEAAQLTLHQPTIKEIGYIGEETFYTGCEFLRFNKDNLGPEDRERLINYSDFEILMSLMREKDPVIMKNRVCVELVMTLIFPHLHFSMKDMEMIFEDKDNQLVMKINKDNYEGFLKVIIAMFCLKGDGENGTDFNPSGDLARRIANKLKDRHKKLAEAKPETAKISILSRYISILTVGEKKDMNELLNYTIYQLFDEFKRYELKTAYDMYIQAKMAGAKDLKEVEDWMQDIHPEIYK